ncbi:MAG: hypothetical protein ACYDDU_20500 [Dermatophilaceae bacterium]
MSALADIEVSHAFIAQRVGRPAKHDVIAGLVMGVIVASMAFSNAVIFVVAPFVYFVIGALTLVGSLERTGVRPHAILLRHRGYLLAAFIVLAWPLIGVVSQGRSGMWLLLPVVAGVVAAGAVPAMGHWRNLLLRHAVFDDSVTPGELAGGS